MSEPVDLSALQQQLQQQRSSLAGQILARLPSSEKATTSREPVAPQARRSATLGVGAEGPAESWTPTDQALRAKLGAKAGTKRKSDQRQKAQALAAAPQDESDDDADSRTRAHHKRAARKDDVFATAEAKIRAGQAKAQEKQPGPPTVPADVKDMSKAQRKKWNKRQRLAQAQEGAARESDVSGGGAGPAAANSAATTETTSPAAAPVSTSASAPTKPTATATATAPASAAPLTALQSSMLASLQGARFRSINEQLYTQDSSAALALLQNEPHLFNEYHAGFRQQVRKWPKNPVDRIAELIEGRAAGSKQKSYPVRAARTPGALVVDMGAGEAGLAKALAPHGFHTLSYDLVDTDDGWVRGLDVAAIGSLPLPGRHAPLGLLWDGPEASASTVDVVVFCLSLMGTNWVDMITEAWRILRPGGELIIAEVTSRLGATGATEPFTELVCAMGFQLDWHDATNNTHFVLCKFSKHVETRARATTPAPLDTQCPPRQLVSQVGNEAQAREARDALVARGAAVLKPCLYKRR